MPLSGPALRAAALLAVGGGLLGGCGPGTGDTTVCLDGGCGGAGSAGHDAAGAETATENDAGASTSGLIAAYEFDQGVGSVALDSSGTFSNAGLIGPFSWGTMGHAGGDVSFSNGYAVLPPILDQARAFSFAAWVKLRTDRIWQRIFDFGNSTTMYMFLTPHSTAETCRFAITRTGFGAEQQLEGPSPLPTGVWKHVAVVLTGASGTLYLDGQPVAAGAVTLRPVDVAPTGNAWLGRSEYTSDPGFDGELDQVRIYDRALSAAEVLALFGQP